MPPVPQCAKPVYFANKQAKKAFEALPKKIREIFSNELETLIANGLPPLIKHDFLPGKTVELKVNGKPAHRCVYKVLNEVVVVLHSFVKTCEGPDKKNLKTLSNRLKTLSSDEYC
jgi:phage-related protein